MTDLYAPPAFQLYAREWLTDTTLLTAEQKGALTDLRAHAWLAASRGEQPCSVPNDDGKLARLSGLGSRWRKVNGPILQFFRAEGDRLVDVQLIGVRDDMEAFHRQRSEAGRKGNEKRWGSPSEDSPSDRSANGSRSHSDRSAIAKSSPASASASASASAAASKSGAEADVVPAAADTVGSHGRNGAAPPAPPADAGAAEDQLRTAPRLPDDAIVLLNRMPDSKRDDGMRQLVATLTAIGARLKAGEYVRAFNAVHLAHCCRQVLESPPDKPEQLARWVLLKLKDTFAEWRSRDEKHAEQRTAPTIAKLVHNAEPVDELGEAHRWVFENPDVKREIEAAAEAKFDGFPKNAAMLRRHSQWIDTETVSRWKAATEPAGRT